MTEQLVRDGHSCLCHNSLFLMDIPVYARTAHSGLPEEKFERESLLNLPSCFLDDPVGQGIELN